MRYPAAGLATVGIAILVVVVVLVVDSLPPPTPSTDVEDRAPATEVREIDLLGPDRGPEEPDDLEELEDADFFDGSTLRARDRSDGPRPTRTKIDVLRERAEWQAARVATSPYDADDTEDLAERWSDLGDEYGKAGDRVRAGEAYRAAMALLLGLADRGAPMASELADLAGDLLEVGDPVSAVECHAAATDLRRLRAETNPENARLRSRLAHGLVASGCARLRAGDTRVALEELTEAVGIIEDLEEGDSVDRLDGIRYSLGNVVYGRCRQGRFSEASVANRRVIEAEKAILETRPDDRFYRRSLSISLSNEGFILYMQGRLEEAQVRIRKSLAMDEALVEEDPENLGYRTGVAVNRNGLGDIHGKWGEWRLALEHYGAARDIAADVRRRDPASTKRDRDLSYDERRVGLALIEIDDLGAAAVPLSAAHERDRALVANHPGNMSALWSLAWSQHDLGCLALAAGDRPAARTWFERARISRETLIRHDPENDPWLDDWALTRECIADVDAAEGKRDSALAGYREAREVFAEIWEREPTHALWQHCLARADEKIGDLLAKAGDRDSALLHLKAARDTLIDLVRRAPHHRPDLERVEGKLE